VGSDDMDPVWMARARREIGVKERPGAEHHPRILEYQSATRFVEGADEVPWCSAFVCWVMEQTGIASTRSAAARSWLKWGKALEQPVPGCVVVLTREGHPGSGHVGFYVRTEGERVLVLGGNQANQVCVRPYAASRVLAYRWPDV
jgi:uncharacterized protein (TIGR02594 family)